MNKREQISRVISTIDRLKLSSSHINYFLDDLEDEGQLILFGGAIRDILLGNTPRDIDIVIDTINDDISDTLNKYNGVKNRYGGYKLNIDNVIFDIWPLNSTWAFKENYYDCSIANLTKTVFFNVDAVAINITNGDLYENGFWDGIQNHSLEIVFKENPFPSLCVLKAFYLKENRSFKFSRQLDNFIFNWVNSVPNPHEELYTIQGKHYCYEVFSYSKFNDLLYSYIP